MLKKLFFLIFFFPVFCLAQVPDFSQTDSTHTSLSKKPQIVYTNDGGVFIGTIVEMNDKEVTIVTKDKGRVVIPKYAIKKIEFVTEKNYQSGEVVSENNFSGKYILGNSAMPMAKGKWEINGLYYTLWSGNYAFSENFSLGMTSAYIYGMVINSKVSIKIAKQTYFGPELHLGYSWFLPNTYYGHANLKLTSGTKENNFTIGIGTAGIYNGNNNYYYYGNRTPTFRSVYTANAGIMKRISNKVIMTGEAWAIIDSENDKTYFVGGFGLKKLFRSGNCALSFGILPVIYPKRNRYYSYSYPYTTSYRDTYGFFMLPFISFDTKF